MDATLAMLVVAYLVLPPASWFFTGAFDASPFRRFTDHPNYTDVLTSPAYIDLFKYLIGCRFYRHRSDRRYGAGIIRRA